MDAVTKEWLNNIILPFKESQTPLDYKNFMTILQQLLGQGTGKAEFELHIEEAKQLKGESV